MAAPRHASRRDAHPLDAMSLDGFELVQSADVVLRAPHDRVWQALAVEADETLFAPVDITHDITHDIIETYGPGEHRCTITVRHDDRTVCVRGLRRLLAHREVIELHHLVDHDELVRTTYTPLHFGRTRMSVDVAVRPTGRRGTGAVSTRAAARCVIAARRVTTAR